MRVGYERDRTKGLIRMHEPVVVAQATSESMNHDTPA